MNIEWHAYIVSNQISSNKTIIIFFNKGSAVNGPDEQGEICVKSPQCFIGYLNQTEKNKDVNNIS